MNIDQISYGLLKNGTKTQLSRKTLMRIILWKEQAGRCHYCDVPTSLESRCFGPQMATLEHLCPRACGGPNQMRNFVMSCQDCNNRRDCKPYAEFCAEMGLDLSEGRRRIALKRERVFRRKKIKKLYKQGKLIGRELFN
jgi:hypothetical protein